MRPFACIPFPTVHQAPQRDRKLAYARHTTVSASGAARSCAIHRVYNMCHSYKRTCGRVRTRTRVCNNLRHANTRPLYIHSVWYFTRNHAHTHTRILRVLAFLAKCVYNDTHSAAGRDNASTYNRKTEATNLLAPNYMIRLLGVASHISPLHTDMHNLIISCMLHSLNIFAYTVVDVTTINCRRNTIQQRIFPMWDIVPPICRNRKTRLRCGCTVRRCDEFTATQAFVGACLLAIRRGAHTNTVGHSVLLGLVLRSL